MNRKDAIEKLNKIIDYYWIEIEDKGMDDEITEIMEVLESPLTLADLLGWEENVEYKYNNGIYKLQNENIYHQHGYAKNLEWEETDYHIDFILRLQLATKVEKTNKDNLLDELRNLVSSERINEIIEELRELENE